MDSKAIIAKVRRAFRRENLPKSKIARIALGSALTVGGVTGAVLPILGVWMIPLGIAVLSVDIPVVRRFARKAQVKWSHWRGKRTRSKTKRRAARA